MARERRKQLTIRFLHRATLFLTFFTLGLVSLFFFGNSQNFLDRSQFIILGVLSVSSVLSTVMGCASLAIELSAFARRRRFVYLSMAGASALCAVVSLAAAFASRGILLVAAGTGR